MNTTKILELVNALEAQRFNDGIFNPWHETCEFDVKVPKQNPAAARRDRMMLHLAGDIRYILCGEAGMYQGSRYTGVPMTCEALMLQNMYARIPAPAQRLSTRSEPWVEPVSRIISKITRRYGIADVTLHWDVLMGCAHRPGEPLTNRRPKMEEATQGVALLHLVAKLFPNARWIALGRCVEDVLTRADIPHSPVRHPANGGATLFSMGLSRVIKQTS